MKGRLLIGIVAGVAALAILGAVAAGLLSPTWGGLLNPAPVTAAETPTANTPSTIVVSGAGSVKAVPDVAYINVGVQTRGATAREAQSETSRMMDAVIAKLKAMGIADKDIQTSGINIYPVTGERMEQITGYWASNSVTVTIEDISRAGEILDGAIDAGANTGGSISFSIKDPSQLYLQALNEAMKDARPKADAIARALGVQITGVRSVSEGYGVSPVVLEQKAAMMDGRGAAPVMPGELTISAQVSVVYAY